MIALVAPPLSLYVHIPWCIKKCPYCDFNSHTGFESFDEQTYIDALLADLDRDTEHTDQRTLSTIFIGGGTPSLFSPTSIDRLLRGVRSRMSVSERCEVTLEANPGSVDTGRFAEFRMAGVSRLSIGVQSFDDDMLGRIGRIHDGTTARAAVEAGLAAGYASVNLDLMYALPGQTCTQALDDVKTAVSMSPDHISHYQLTIEPNTLFYAQRPVTPGLDETWEMQQICLAELVGAGYQHYEISAYARRGAQCGHNLNYWRFGDYLGIGAGAHGKLTRVANQVVERREKHKHPKRYLAGMENQNFIQQYKICSEQELIFEFMLNRCRLRETFSLGEFERYTGQGRSVIADRILVAKDDGLLCQSGDDVSWTPFGLRFLDDLLLRFLPDGCSFEETTDSSKGCRKVREADAIIQAGIE